MPTCPECGESISELAVEEDAHASTLFDGEHYYDIDFELTGGGEIEYCCRECGEVLFSDEAEARDFLCGNNEKTTEEELLSFDELWKCKDEHGPEKIFRAFIRLIPHVPSPHMLVMSPKLASLPAFDRKALLEQVRTIVWPAYDAGKALVRVSPDRYISVKWEIEEFDYGRKLVMTMELQ